MNSQDTNPQADAFIANAEPWREELAALRRIALASPLTEAFKWGKPCYTLAGGNVAILYAFKDTCAIGFFKGALLSDPTGLLRAPGENSQAMRMARFTDASQIAAREAELKALLAEAIALESAGIEVPFTRSAAPELPEELTLALAQSPDLKTAFEALTPGRRRAYALEIGGAKQAATRAARVEKHRARILAGKGLND